MDRDPQPAPVQPKGSQPQLPGTGTPTTETGRTSVNPYIQRLNWQPAHKAIQSRSWLRDSASLSGTAELAESGSRVSSSARFSSQPFVASGYSDMTGLASAGIHGAKPQRSLGGLAFAESPVKPSSNAQDRLPSQGGSDGAVTVGGVAWCVGATDGVDDDDTPPPGQSLRASSTSVHVPFQGVAFVSQCTGGLVRVTGDCMKHYAGCSTVQQRCTTQDGDVLLNV